MKLYKIDFTNTIGNNVVTVPTDSEFLIGLSNGDSDATVKLYDGETEIESLEDKIGAYTAFQFTTSGTPSRKHYKGVFTKTETEGEDEEAVTTVIYNVTVDILVICQKMSVAYRDLTGGGTGGDVDIVTEIDGDSTDTEVPSAKCVYTELQEKVSKVSNPTTGNFAGLDANGNITDSGSKASDFLTSQTQSNWNESDSASAAYIQNKPTIPDVSGKENTSNKVTSLSASSTDTEYPSAKCVYDLIGDVETLINAI